MAGTVRWGQLHLRFSNLIRDAVGSPLINGKDLTRGDRDTYLNSGYQKYIGLFVNLYRNDTELLGNALQSMVKLGYGTCSLIGKINQLPSDFGYILSISKPGASVSLASPEMFNLIADGRIAHKVPSASNQYFCPQLGFIALLPENTSSGVYRLSYIIKPAYITYNPSSGEDLPLDESHYTTILGFAYSALLNDRQDYAQSDKVEKEAIKSSPYLAAYIEDRKNG